MKIIATLTGVVLLLPMASFAAARVPLQPTSALQPLPIEVRPNVSGNTNSTLQPAVGLQPTDVQNYPEPTAGATNNPSATNTASEEKTQGTPSQSRGLPWLLIAVVVGMFAAIVIISLAIAR